MIRYRYVIDGIARIVDGTVEVDGTPRTLTWQTSGEVDIVERGNFPAVLDEAMLATFKQLTEGRAVYGKPGVGCRGPYTFKRVLIEEVE